MSWWNNFEHRDCKDYVPIIFVNGKDGLNGKDGKDGVAGKNGENGKDATLANVIQIIPYASGKYNTLTTNADGTPKVVSILGFGSSYEHNNFNEIKLDNLEIPNYALYTFNKTIIDSLDVHCTVVEKTNVLGSGQIRATIYVSNGTVFTPLTTVMLNGALTGTISAGTMFNGRVNNLGIEIDSQNRVLVVISIKNNYANANTVKVQTNASLKIKTNQ